MKYLSTAGGVERFGFSEAMLAGLAPDGGLLVPVVIPRIDIEPWLRGPAPDPKDLAQAIIGPFLAGDPLESALRGIVGEVFQIPLPVTELSGGHLMLELFHGPTAAFKDFGAGFLAHSLSHIEGRRRVIVATSGDTGGAVAAACDGRPGMDVVILYPDGGVSACQEKQLTCWGDNVHAFAVAGSFDHCQRMVKQALTQNPWPGVSLTTANSISIARLVPQVVHHALAALRAHQIHGRALDFLIPSGNLGNATAALWAKRMGFPIRRIQLVCNANRVVPDFLASGKFEPRASLPTLANAMDIGNPSNLARLRHGFPSFEALSRDLSALSISDEEIQLAIQKAYQREGRIFDPHTATAYAALGHLGPEPKLLVSTAHPAKFRETLEPLLPVRVPIPASLERLGGLPSKRTELAPNQEALRVALT